MPHLVNCALLMLASSVTVQKRSISCSKVYSSHIVMIVSKSYGVHDCSPHILYS